MTCIKTGARVYFNDYGFVVPADIYVVGGCYVIRWNTEGKEYVTGTPDLSWWIVSLLPGENWHRDDLGVTVVPIRWVIRSI